MTRCPEPECSCAALPTRAGLGVVPDGLAAAFAARDVNAVGELLAGDVRRGDDAIPNQGQGWNQVVATFARLLAMGLSGEADHWSMGPTGLRTTAGDGRLEGRLEG